MAADYEFISSVEIRKIANGYIVSVGGTEWAFKTFKSASAFIKKKIG